eukprot:2802491-Rhodomonas_salina.1
MRLRFACATLLLGFASRSACSAEAAEREEEGGRRVWMRSRTTSPRRSFGSSVSTAEQGRRSRLRIENTGEGEVGKREERGGRRGKADASSAQTSHSTRASSQHAAPAPAPAYLRGGSPPRAPPCSQRLASRGRSSTRPRCPRGELRGASVPVRGQQHARA